MATFMLVFLVRLEPMKLLHLHVDAPTLIHTCARTCHESRVLRNHKGAILHRLWVGAPACADDSHHARSSGAEQEVDIVPQALRAAAAAGEKACHVCPVALRDSYAGAVKCSKLKLYVMNLGLVTTPCGSDRASTSSRAFLHTISFATRWNS